MSDYFAPLNDIEFILNHVAGLDSILKLDSYGDLDNELVSAILDESSKFTSEVLAPLNRVGDEHGSICEDGEVTTPPGWKEAYHQFIENGWNGLAFDPAHGGQGLPWLVATAVQEMWHSANMSFGLCPLLTQGAIRALELHGSDEQRAIYLERLVTGVWAGTMNLTEAHAGSDLAVIRTRAVAEGDHYRLIGQKIFITYGEHDLTENIIHFVLGRCTDSPDGVKGISLFIVPKFLVNDDGSIGERNDLRCVSLEHKLGIHASPTAVMSYGDNEGAIGYLIGEKNKGLEYMFTMMNLARHAVGVEGLAIAERAYQQARDYAGQRVQGSAAGGSRERVPIIRHPDVRRMLLTMKSLVQAMRCLAYYTSAVFDLSQTHPDADSRSEYAADLGLLIPLVKGWCAEMGNEVAYLGVQVHGGMGFIEETGAAQYSRDARITPIYEGTTGIQANDLIGRKVLRDEKGHVLRFMTKIQDSLNVLSTQGDSVAKICQATETGLESLRSVTDWVVESGAKDASLPAAASVGYLHVFSLTVAGWLMAIYAAEASELLNSGDEDQDVLSARLLTAEFFATHIMPRLRAHAEGIVNSSACVMALSEDQI
ncbi:MAG: acyl-CoA dehydrogenase [Acidiferrobacterales bacterium]|nr:acyl-CoA dehydrogenase [Acidiferrobacterales bacterium]